MQPSITSSLMSKVFWSKSLLYAITQSTLPSQSVLSAYSKMSRSQISRDKVINVKDIRGFDLALSSCAEALSQGHVIALPTDTIYGVACLAQNTEAVNRVYNIKQRQCKNPVAICVAEVEDVYKWGVVTVSTSLLRDLLPGPVTLVFQRTPDLNPSLNPDTELVGIRIPDHRFIRSLCARCQEPLALTSANVSASQSTLAVEEFESLWPQLSVICDGGRVGGTVESRRGSTVVDLSQPSRYAVLREGSAYKSTVNLLAKYGLSERHIDER